MAAPEDCSERIPENVYLVPEQTSRPAPSSDFHALRHSAVTNVYRAKRDLFLAQRFARHASPLTTVISTHPADEELAAGIRDLPC